MSIYTDPYQHSYPPLLFVTPTLALLNPASIVVNTPTQVTVTGTGFHPGSVIWADEEAQVTTYVSATILRYTAQADAVGAQDITVHNGSAASASLTLTVTATGGLEAPTSANSKAQIVAWLRGHGVELDDDALMQLSKAELLDIVAELLNEEK